MPAAAGFRLRQLLRFLRGIPHFLRAFFCVPFLITLRPHNTSRRCLNSNSKWFLNGGLDSKPLVFDDLVGPCGRLLYPPRSAKRVDQSLCVDRLVVAAK